MGLRQRIGEFFAGGRQVISEIIGRTQYAVVRSMRWVRSDDRTQADYEFWDKLRRGKIATYKLGALFAKPIIEHVSSWMLGDGFRVSLPDASDNAQDEATRFVNRHMKDIVEFVKDSMALGDAYLVVNADGTLTAVPANQVEIKTNPLDYREVDAYIITTVLDTATITDEYRMDGRTVTVKTGTGESVFEYANVIGMLPVVHLPYARASNEVFGHPIYEALLPLFAQYDDVIMNSLAGVKTMSNPIPALENVEDPAEELEALSTASETYTDAQGNTITERTVDMDGLSIIATSGQFNFKAPAAFTDDSWRMLKALFLLMLQHGNIPEWVWGGAIASSKASVEAQMPAWVKFINAQRLMIEDVLQELILIYVATIALYVPGVSAGGEVEIEWSPVAPEDKSTHLQYVKHASASGLITAETELELLNLVKDATTEVKMAMAEAADRAAENDRFGDAWERALEEAQGEAV